MSDENEDAIPQSTKLFQINESDLADLEQSLPILTEAIGVNMNGRNNLCVRIRRVQQIIMNVRWGYQPYTNVGIIPAGDSQEENRND